MKTILKKTLMLVLGFILIQGTVIAQDGLGPKGPKADEIPGQLRKSLSEQQREMLRANQAINKEMREAFKASLTDAQKAILDNAELAGQEKRDAFRASLTDDQLGMLESQKATRLAQKEAFHASLSDAQKAMMKKVAMKRNQKAKSEAVKNRGNKGGKGK